MTIRTKLLTTALAPLGIAIFIVTFHWWVSGQIKQARAMAELAESVIDGTVELNALTHEYLLHHEARSRSQWEAKHRSLANLMADSQVPWEEEARVLERLCSDHEAVGLLFSQIVKADREAAEGPNPSLAAEWTKRLVGQLLVKSRTMVSDARQLSKSGRARLTSVRRTTDQLMIILALGLLVAMALILFSVGITISKSLAKLRQRAEAIASGRLDQTVSNVDTTTRDEIGQLSRAFDQMVGSLRYLLTETKTMTEEVATSSNEITTGAQQQVASLTESATSLNQITTTAEQFKSTIQEFADRARAVQEAAEEMGRRSDEGRGLTQESVNKIDQVRENAQAAGESVLDLSEQMQRINEVTSSVNEIAEQTKLLSLNASIEAARAGEEGRGFAVVATQVRELANQSKEAARRIESIISETQKSMQTVVTKIKEGSRLSEESRGIVKTMNAGFEQIATAVHQTIEAMRQIAAGAKDQELGMTQLANGIAQVELASTEALATTQQTQKSIEAIGERIRTLNDRMGRFKT
jgi:methyl-accepting chemotaxis protein